MSSLDYLDLCRLCLVKDRVSVPIFDGEGDVRQIFLKIAACLPVKVAREDKLPKKICDDCVYKVELFYQFWNTTANAEKQLLQWLGDVGLEEKQGYVSEVLSSEIMKQEESENRLDVSVMQATGEHTNNMAINMIDEMNLGIPIIMSTDQQITVPISSSNNVQTGQSVPGPSTRSRQNQVTPKSAIHDAEEDTSEDDNSDDDCDADDGLAVKEEGEDATSGNRAIEPTTFVNVALACDEAGPSGLQQQKLVDMPAMGMQQSSEGDSKSGYFVSKLAMLSQTQCNVGEMKVLCDGSTELVLTESLQVPKTENEIIVPADSFIQCALCGDAFICEEELAMHLKTHDHVQPRQHHQEIVEEIIGEQDDEDEMEEEDEEEEDEEEEVLEEDMVETLEEEEEEDEEGEEENEKVVYVCEHCGRSFNTTVLLRKHQQQVHNTPDKFYVCEICGYSSPHKQNLINHQRRHNLEYKYRCEVCGAGFYARNIYQEHQLVHSREKPFQCEICNATFRYRQGLRLHAKLHQPDYIPPQKKHLCELCNKRFSRKQVLLVHMRTHGNGGPQNEYICHICGKAVSSKTYLTVHVRKHTGEKPHVCDLCGKGFISQNYLSVHRRTHTGERPHKCTHCDKRFTQRTTLVVHLRGHTGDRPYPCTFCHKSFASKTMLNSHLKTHAKQNARAQMEQQQQHDRHYQQEINPEHLNHEQLEIQDTLHVDELQQSEMHQDELQDQSHVRTLENVTILLPS